MIYPNFFILGAPKSGTTSLYKYLSEHPNIFMSKIKGPHFFSSDVSDQIKDILYTKAADKIEKSRSTVAASMFVEPETIEDSEE